MCIVYIAYMVAVVLTGKLRFLLFFCKLCLSRHVYIHLYLNTISYQVAAG